MKKARGKTELARVIIVGLGPSGPDQLTGAAREVLKSTRPLLFRTARHPGVKHWLKRGARSLDHCYDEASDMDGAYRAIVEEVISEARSAGVVAYAVPGSPFVLEDTVSMLAADPRVQCEFVTGMSFLELCWARLGLDPLDAGIRLLDGEHGVSHVELSGPALIAQVWSRDRLSELKLSFEAPPSRAVLLHHLGLADEVVQEVAFSDLDKVIEADHLTSVYLPEPGETLASRVAHLIEVVRILRERCPWDAAQTHRSLVRHLIEETYEAIEAIDDLGEPAQLEHAAHLEEELGDVLCQVVFHAAIATEEGLFSFADVVKGLDDKLVYRHPHIFPRDGEALYSAEAVLEGWERDKAAEKGRTSAMEGIPAGLPAIAYAEKIERRARSVGLGSTPEEARQVLERSVEALLEGEEGAIGPALLALCVLSAQSEGYAEDALRKATRGLREEVLAAEAAAFADGVDLARADAAAQRRYLEFVRQRKKPL